MRCTLYSCNLYHLYFFRGRLQINKLLNRLILTFILTVSEQVTVHILRPNMKNCCGK